MSKTPTGSRAPTEKESTKAATGAREGVSILCMELDTTCHCGKGKGSAAEATAPPSGIRSGCTLGDGWLLLRSFGSGLRIFIPHLQWSQSCFLLQTESQELPHANPNS